jgi:hypothetical protein
MSAKKLIRWALYYTAGASAYNLALNLYTDSVGGSAPPLPLLPNPAFALLNNLMGASAPKLLDQSTGSYGTWG